MFNFKRKNKITLESLKYQLQDSKIDTSNWGIGQTKTLDDLFKEIREGESILVNIKNNELIRKVVGVGVNVYYIDYAKHKFILHENKQVFNDGSTRQRNLGTSISEKLKLNEKPEDTALRGIKEELSIKSKINLKKIKTTEENHISLSYPNLYSHYIKYNFEVYLDNKQFNPRGYTEEENGTRTYFTWKKL